MSTLGRKSTLYLVCTPYLACDSQDNFFFFFSFFLYSDWMGKSWIMKRDTVQVQTIIPTIASWRNMTFLTNTTYEVIDWSTTYTWKQRRSKTCHLTLGLWFVYTRMYIHTHTKIRFWDSIWEKIISWNTDLHREKLRKWVEERTCHFTSPLPCLFHERVNLYKCFYEGNTEKHVFWMEG